MASARTSRTSYGNGGEMTDTEDLCEACHQRLAVTTRVLDDEPVGLCEECLSQIIMPLEDDE